MSIRTNNRIVSSNKPIVREKCRKCIHHRNSYSYTANLKIHDEIMQRSANNMARMDPNSQINILIVFHFMAPNGTYNRDRVITRAHDIVTSLNDDFNNYTTNPNTMNNFRYKNIVNQVFMGNTPKQSRYLGPQYMSFLPTGPANITFEMGEVYFYPVKNKLSLGQYDDISEPEMQHQAIKQYIHTNRAEAISPDQILNIWVIDMTDTSVLGFSNFPWEPMDNYHGVVVHRRVFFPEDYSETGFGSYKTFTHEIGHFLGLPHVFSHNNDPGRATAVNINSDNDFILDNMADTPYHLAATYDPTDRINNKRLHTDENYNPLFMNFMDYTYDKYVTMFTQNQIQKMRHMIMSYRPNINSNINRVQLPKPKYNPETSTLSTRLNSNIVPRTSTTIPSREPVNNPRGQLVMPAPMEMTTPVVDNPPLEQAVLPPTAIPPEYIDNPMFDPYYQGFCVKGRNPRTGYLNYLNYYTNMDRIAVDRLAADAANNPLGPPFAPPLPPGPNPAIGYPGSFTGCASCPRDNSYPIPPPNTAVAVGEPIPGPVNSIGMPVGGVPNAANIPPPNAIMAPPVGTANYSGGTSIGAPVNGPGTPLGAPVQYALPNTSIYEPASGYPITSDIVTRAPLYTPIGTPHPFNPRNYPVQTGGHRAIPPNYGDPRFGYSPHPLSMDPQILPGQLPVSLTDPNYSRPGGQYFSYPNDPRLNYPPYGFATFPYDPSLIPPANISIATPGSITTGVPAGSIVGTVPYMQVMDDPVTEIPVNARIDSKIKEIIKPYQSRTYTRYSQAKPESKINSLVPNSRKEPSNMKEVLQQRTRIYEDPGDAMLEQRIDNVQNQLRNIKTKLVDRAVAAQNAPSESVRRVDPMIQMEYGTANDTGYTRDLVDTAARFDSYSEPLPVEPPLQKNCDTCPRRKFTRTRPANINPN